MWTYDTASYQALYERSIEEPETFWAEQAKAFLHFEKPYKAVLASSLAEADVRCFVGGKLKVCYHCVD